MVLALALLWVVAIGALAVMGKLREPIAPRGDLVAFERAALAHIDASNVGNAALALLQEGRVFSQHTRSAGAPVDASTLFQMAAVSQWVTAWGVMRLVEQGAIDLEAPASQYLTRWQLPESPHDVAGVTVRRLLSHTAGLTDGLGYRGFESQAEVQTLEDSLTEAADASKSAEKSVRVGREPGSRWQYSGGGYTILQLLVEEVSGESFASYMGRHILAPLGMQSSTFAWDESLFPRLAATYDRDLEEAPHYHYTALAAASLYSTLADAVRFLEAHLEGPGGEPPGRGVLRPETVARMREPEGRVWGRGVWGLGVILFASNGEGGYVIGHDGSNRPALNHSLRLNPATGNGIVVLSSGAPPVASRLGDEWVFWETGNLGLMVLQLEAAGALWFAGTGVLAIATAAMVGPRLLRRLRSVAEDA